MTLTNGGSFNDKVNFIWSVADLLRGDLKQSEYGRVILPLVVLRRLDCVLAETKEAVVERAHQLEDRVDNPDKALKAAAGHEFYNTSRFDFAELTDDPSNVRDNLKAFIGGFSSGARDVIDKFRFDDQITRLDDADLLYQVVARFADIDLHPDQVDNHEMGYIYEELIRRFSEQSNETAGEHFTPREVIRLMVDLLLTQDDHALRKPGVVRTLFDPACGTGGMLAVAEDRLAEMNPNAHLEVYGQELNDESYAICRSDMMLKGQASENIKNGNSFSNDQFKGQRFDYLLANPPFGVEWKKVQKDVKDEAKNLGFHGRFGAGLPRITDGSLLFIQHMISKMKTPEEGGSRLAIVFNGSPLFTGAAGSGESEIRRWIIENDWLEAVIALPDQLFYNTGITTYFWIVTNRKSSARAGFVQLLDARDQWTPEPTPLGEKRKRISQNQIDQIVAEYGAGRDSANSIVIPNEALAHVRVAIEFQRFVAWDFDEASLAALRRRASWSGASDDERARVLDTLSRVSGERYMTKRDATQAIGDAPSSLRTDLLKCAEVTDPRGEPQEVGGRSGSRPKPDTDLREYESLELPDTTVAWSEDPNAPLQREDVRQSIESQVRNLVLRFNPSAFIGWERTSIGYSIPFNEWFWAQPQLAQVDGIRADLEEDHARVRSLLKEAGIE